MSEAPSVEAVTEALRMTGLAEFMFQEETLPVHVQAVRAAARAWLRIQENALVVERDSNGRWPLEARKLMVLALHEEHPYTVDCEFCVVAWLPQHEHRRDVFMGTPFTEDEFDALVGADKP